jgi:outer membrane protein OmpA-like peptidoglycan-associated protein
VKIIHVGETITVVLPSDKLFYPDSANLNPCFKPVLKAASDFIFCYEKMTVKIGAYTDNLCSPHRNCVLTQAQAQTIAKALWCNGIDARLLVAVGYGPDFPIASNATCPGRIQNRRVEICFRYIPPYSPGC